MVAVNFFIALVFFYTLSTKSVFGEVGKSSRVIRQNQKPIYQIPHGKKNNVWNLERVEVGGHL